MRVLCLPLIDVFKKCLPDFGKPQDCERNRGLEPLNCSYIILICSSETVLNSILKDGNPQWREKKVFVRVSLMLLMMIMLKFVGKKFFIGKNSNNNLWKKRLTRFAIAWPLQQHKAEKPLLLQEFMNTSVSMIHR